jgi:hypothetical protein
MFQSIPLEEAINVMMKRRTDEIHEVWSKAQKSLTKFEAEGMKPVSTVRKPQFVLIPEGDAYILEGKKAIRAAQSSVDCITSSRRFLQMMLLAGEDVIEAMERGVKFRFILEKPITEKALPRALKKFFKTDSCSIKYSASSSHPHAIVAVNDKREAQIAVSTEEDLAKSSMLMSTSPALVMIINDYFETIWSQQSEDTENAKAKERN